MRYKISLIIVILMIFLSGCLGGGSGNSLENPVELVPEDNNVVVQVDTGILYDKNVKEVANTWFQSENLSSDNVNNLQDFTSSFSQQWTTNVSDINEGIMFYEDQEFGLNNTNGMFFEGNIPAEEAGYIFDTDLSEEDVVSSLEDKIEEENLETELNTIDYKGYEIYEILDSGGETAYFVHLGQGVFVNSFSQEPVNEVIDVYEEDEGGISGQRLTEMRMMDGYVNVMATDYEEGLDGESAFASFYSTTGNKLGSSAELHYEESDEAEFAKFEMEKSINELTNQLESYESSGFISEESAQKVETLLNKIEFNRTNQIVEINFEAEASIFSDLISELNEGGL